MKRALALFAATLVAILLAAAGQAAEVIGTVVSTDPTTNTIVVRSADGRETIYRTTRTTTIERGGSTVQLQAVQPGTQVQIMADPAAPPPATAGTTTIVYPVASGIVVSPPSSATPQAAPAPAPMAAPAERDTESERHIEVKEKHESDEDDD